MPEASSSSGGFSLFKPSEGINYNFVVYTYAAASIIGAGLLGLDKVAGLPQVEGYWIIFSPFLPCLLWSLVVRQRWLKERKASKAD